ncbi:hypothetical protein [Streptomyces sp. NPDC008317]|uniref:hypothetical protein n=1 Tax=Streptomyces sp. NPDC008317 TaxID=3364827 RepID=UPI0036F097D6
MREFDAEQVQQLLAGPRFVDEPGERACPACGAVAVRTYVYRRVGPHRTVRITYMWCASCRRHKGWTGPDAGPSFDDPLLQLPEAARDILLKDLESLFAKLDALWEAGDLPQHFGD